ncbi:MAG: proline dehydrogenase family protein [Steroidobacteraceae bacterium]
MRLVKGAYWDTEIKRAQERGLAGFPVFTRKANTDVSYLACARQLASHTDVIYPQFATHNAHTVAYVAEVMSGAGPDRFEYQRLHGMGEELYEQVLHDGDGAARPRVACRVYAPVGPHEDLLPYLVRRLLENGANTSFVNRISDERLPPGQIIIDPVAEADATHPAAEPRIALPAQLFGAQRRNSRGINFADGTELRELLAECDRAIPAMRPIADATPAGRGAGPGMRECGAAGLGSTHE